MPDLQGGEVGLFFGLVGGLGGVRIGRLGVAGIAALFILFFLLLLDRPQPDGDHAAVVRPGGGSVADWLQSVGNAGGVGAEDRHLHAAVEVAPGEDIVRRALGGSVVAGAEGREIVGVVSPAEALIRRSGRVGGAEGPGAGVVDLHAVADVGAGGDGEREEGPDRAPGHLAHVAECGLGTRRQGDHTDIGALAGGLVRRVTAQRDEAAGGVEAVVRDRVELPGLAGLQVHHRGLLPDRFVPLLKRLPFLRRQSDRPPQPAAICRKPRCGAPGKHARRVLVELADAEFGLFIDARDHVGDPVAEG